MINKDIYELFSDLVGKLFMTDVINDKCYSRFMDLLNSKPIKDISSNLSSGLTWVPANEGNNDWHGKLYLAYQPGYPLMVADWKTGRGYRDISTDRSINPTKVAIINLPEEGLS